LTLSIALQKTRTLSRVFQQGGPRGVFALLRQKLQMTWRRGEVWEVGRLWGRSTQIARLDGCKFTIDPALVPANVIDLLLSNLYEQPEREALKKFLDPEMPVVEFGACIGVVSCLLNRSLNRPENHVVVEANPAMLPILKENRERNGCRFQVVHAALAHGADTVTFNISDNVLASSLHGAEQQAVVVPTVTLERLLNEHGFERATLVCDVEGAELQLVENEIDTLSKRIVAIMMETHERLVGEEPTLQMLARLKSAGFEMVNKDGDVVVLLNRA
jgi:FkbM family methyltransferase